MEFNKKIQIALGQMFNGLELKSKKYNFNAVKNLKDKIQDAERIINLQEDGLKWLDKTKDARKEYMKIWTDAEGINRGADRQAGNVLDELDEAIAKVGNSAKDLGVNEKSISEYTQGLKLLGELRENRGAYQEIKKELDKLK